MLHIGQEIKKVLKERKLKVVDFASRINTDRNNVYNIYRRKSIDTDLLARISETLEYDFFMLYSRGLTFHNVVQSPGVLHASRGNESAPEKLLHLLEESISILEDRLADKEEIIRLLKQQKA